MKLFVGAFIGMALAAGGVVHSLNAVPPSRAPVLNTLQLCRFGGVELIDERCDATGACAKQSVRLAWTRGEGVLFEGDSTGERELRRIKAPELERLLSELGGLRRLATDVDPSCRRDSTECGGVERAFTITTDCEWHAGTDTFLGAKPAWERVRDARAECVGPWSAEQAQCVARSTWRAAFVTHLAVRFGTVFHRLRDAGRG